MASLPYETLAARASSVLASAGIDGAEVTAGDSLPGAGSVPGRTLPSPVIRIERKPDNAWRKLADAPDSARRPDLSPA